MTTSILQSAYDAAAAALDEATIGGTNDQALIEFAQAVNRDHAKIAVDAAMAVMDQNTRALLEDAAKALELFACNGQDRHCSCATFYRQRNCANDQARATLAKIKDALK